MRSRESEIRRDSLYCGELVRSNLVETGTTASPVGLQAKDRSQLIAVSSFDRVFKGTLDRQRIAFK